MISRSLERCRRRRAYSALAFAIRAISIARSMILSAHDFHMLPLDGFMLLAADFWPLDISRISPRLPPSMIRCASAILLAGSTYSRPPAIDFGFELINSRR